jgi:hypothetical protein
MIDEWKDWASLSLPERSQLPSEPGIYVIADAQESVWYVGQAADLKSRWSGKSHHRYPQLIRTNRKRVHRIYWKLVPLALLDEREKFYIDLFTPELNGQKVKKYLPKEPQVFREIKRLLKVLNQPTLLFPDVRSVVLGEYQGENDIRHILILIHGNDFMLLDKSCRKRYGPKIRNAWLYPNSTCGKDEKLYRPCHLGGYRFMEWQFEFIEVQELMDQFCHSTALREQALGSVDLFGVSVVALKDLEFLDQVNWSEAYQNLYSDGRLLLKQGAYLSFIRPRLKEIQPVQFSLGKS